MAIEHRGYIYHTLRLICGAKMSLTDLHFFLPDDFYDFAELHEYEIEMRSSDYSWAAGQEMIDDFSDRIPKALPTLNDARIANFLNYIKRMIPFNMPDKMGGACLGVKIIK